MTVYENCGVSITAGDSFISNIKSICGSTYDSHVLQGIGPFCSLYRLPTDNKQILASSTDGVGTKVILAKQLSKFGYLKTIGIDLVAMVINDIITCGAKPLFLLDYYAASNLLSDQENNFIESNQIIEGIVNGCKLAGCSLIGGETAEIRGILKKDMFDLAAFGVGIVNECDIVGPHLVKRGDHILGLESSGPHSNGYSLIRHVYQNFNWFDWNDDEVTRNTLMVPTRIYSSLILTLLSLHDHGIHALAHITGGGLEYNTSRVVPNSLKVNIDWKSWIIPSIYNDIQQRANITDNELRQVLNCGIGFIILCDPNKTTNIMEQISKFNIGCYKIGEVVD